MKFVTIVSLGIFLTLSVNAQLLTFEKTDEGVWIKEDGANVLFYQAMTKSLNGKSPRANYIHPLYNIDGFELTEDFPLDHLHHRGIFWTWHQVIIGEKQIGDSWECKEFAWDVIDVIASGKRSNSIMLHAKTNWLSALWKDENGKLKPFLEENAMITIQAIKDNYRVIDFEISLLALVDNLKIGGSTDAKGYGGFSVRMKLPKDIKFDSQNGEMKPITNQLDAGAWMNVSGSLATNNGKGGVVMICHPDNPLYPEKWIIRKKGSMQNPVFPGRSPVSISTTTPTILKYRLLVYTGQMTSNDIQQMINWK